MAKCDQCGRQMNPIERMMGPVCIQCCRANHAAVVGQRPIERPTTEEVAK